jgi:mannose-6-phosphate isomerase-like protein (cupin superfamily)
MRKKCPRLLPVAFCLLAMSAPAVRAEQEPPSPVVRLYEILSAHPLNQADTLSSVELLRGQGVSAHLIQVRSRVRPHFHKEHEETVYIIEGSGIFVLGDRAYPVKAGALMVIPRGAIHSFEAKVLTKVLSIFDPPFDPEDRVLVDEPGAKP